MRQKYFDIAVKQGSNLEALHEEPITYDVNWQAVLIFAIGTGVLFLISRYGDVILDMIRESSSTVVRETINISKASVEFFTNQNMLLHASQYPENYNLLRNLILDIKHGRT